VNLSGELRRKIEDMALQLIVGESDISADASAWIPVLEKISAAAARENAESVAAAATRVGQSLRTLTVAPPDDPGAVAAVLQQGILNLQKAMEDPEREVNPQEKLLSQDPELMSDFIVESREHLVNIESQVLTLEREPTDSEALNAVFRGFHTIKGLAGFLELWEVQKLAHEVETVLDRARNSQWTINPAGIDVILESADYLRRWLVHMEAVLHQETSEAPARDEVLLSRITRLSSESSAAESGGCGALSSANLDQPASTVAAGKLSEPKVLTGNPAPILAADTVSTPVALEVAVKKDEALSAPAATTVATAIT